jgi:DNA repair exonuclease SbcCD ATPase subunit
LTPDEIRTEIHKYEAKEARIREYMEGLRNGTVDRRIYSDGPACPGCGQGWREFDSHRKDLEQLTMAEAKGALGANTRYLNKLRG